jgi:hypothetical protein
MPGYDSSAGPAAVRSANKKLSKTLSIDCSDLEAYGYSPPEDNIIIALF